MAQLSPEFTARLVDRWQEPEAAPTFDPSTILENPAAMRDLLLTYFPEGARAGSREERTVRVILLEAATPALMIVAVGGMLDLLAAFTLPRQA